MPSSVSSKQNSFAEDVRTGLSSTPKFLSSKYFYDDEGSRLFQEIMQLPEYYLTRAESEIFQTQAAEIYAAFSAQNSLFDLLELGAGDGTKTAILIENFLQHDTAFTYAPIDISLEAIEGLTRKFQTDFPALKMNAKPGDYFQILESLQSSSQRRRILLFLGSNIGNFSLAQAIDFFRRLRQVMNQHDLLFIGFDLHKDPRVILRAYDDAQGVTAAFNLNFLHRMNRELGADFDPHQFSHNAIYHPVECAARSFLISHTRQDVYVKALQQNFSFKPWEPIFMEISQKYSLEMIDELAQKSGFQVVRNFFDGQHYFADSLWEIA